VSPSKRGYDAAWQKLRARVLRASNVCFYCGARATEVDHLIPISKGGRSEPGNCVSACKPCNSAKRDRLPTNQQLALAGIDDTGVTPRNPTHSIPAAHAIRRSLFAVEVGSEVGRGG
jgi:hypothetical protein